MLATKFEETITYYLSVSMVYINQGSANQGSANLTARAGHKPGVGKLDSASRTVTTRRPDYLIITQSSNDSNVGSRRARGPDLARGPEFTDPWSKAF